MVVKNQAIEEYDRVFGWVTRAFESLFSLAGLEELARRIRPSVRRKGRRAVDEEDALEEQTSPAESPSDDASSTGAPAEPQSPPAAATPPSADS